MLRGLLPVKLVNPGGSVSDCFVSFHELPDVFSSIEEGNKDSVWTLPGNPNPLFKNFQQKNTSPSPGYGDTSARIMYVCGTVAADLSARDLSQTDSQPRFFKTADYTRNLFKEYITITYVSNPKSLRQKP